MTKVTLKILASDIRETSYFRGEDCPITRALHRAGYPHLKDCGTDICDQTGRGVIDIYENRVYEDLTYKVQEMCFGKVEPKNFQVTLELDL